MAKNNKSELTKEQIENIKNYGGQIETIEDLMAIIKLRPGLFIGRIGNPGFINMVREIFQNSLDELIKTDSPCKHIWVYYHEATNTVIIRDDGRGLPFDNIVRIYTAANTSSNYHKKEGEFSAGMHGTGSKAVNALSKDFIVESYVLGEARRVEFSEGYPWKLGEKEIPNPDNYQGSIVEFRPNYEYMGEITSTWKDVYKLLSDLTPLSKIGAIVHFEAVDLNGKVIKETIINEDGIITDLIKKTISPIVKPIIIQKYTGQMTVDIAFTYDSDDLAVENITQFANMCPTLEGTHVDGLLSGICKFFADYMNKIYLANNKKLTVVRNDVKLGLKAIISVFHLNPIFTGQAKEIFSNKEMDDFVFRTVLNSLGVWSKNNPNDLQKLCKYFKDVAEIRVNSDKEKVKLTNNYKASSVTGLPKDYKKANGTRGLEIIIIEGLSAGGGAGIVRDKEYQAIFPIRGKLPNAFDTPRSKFLNNAEVSAFIVIFDCGYGKNFDIVKFKSKWSKVILMPDKDADGGHIRQLCVYMFMLYFPAIITHGMLYTAMPPLFGYKQKNNKMVYFQDRLDYIKFVQDTFISKNVVKNMQTQKQYSNKELTSIIYRGGDFVEEIDRVSGIFAIDPYVLERIIQLSAHKYEEFKSRIEHIYRFLKVRKNTDGVVIIEGLVGDSYQTIVFNEKMRFFIDPLIVKAASYDFDFILNDQNVSLYHLMKVFSDTLPNITRYKGLGEMNPDDLGESTLRPGNRTLCRILMPDIVQSISEIREINSNKKLLLDAIGKIKITKDDIV